jgi:hypothetical protein
VLVSGRDDHGELASAQVALFASPGGSRPVGQVRDQTLARVVAVRGTWLQVRTVEGPPVQGWVDDFYLRRTLHLVGTAPSCQVSLAGHQLAAGEQALVLQVDGARVRVHLVGAPDSHGRTGWVSRASVHELAPIHGCSHGSEATDPGGHHH